ncbi:MAG: DUF262 domain-containing protein [Actinobacteria bacterium]|nr:DUF262 domain-containing protein [Actinomycetota bacterium]
MSFQSPVTVEHVLSEINTGKYLLPAIQREFVWDPNQILALVDSLMRGYPIGSFLLWEVKPESTKTFTFYNFITNFHEKDAPYATTATVPAGRGLTAVLDGQQRLTSLNVAFYGSHSQKKKGAWSTNLSAYPKRRVYLNLADDVEREELGLRYDLRFLTDQESARQDGEPDRWFLLHDVFLLADSGPVIMAELTKRGVDLNVGFERLYRLYDAVRVVKPINWYLEQDQDSDKVLDIFVRVNSGGTTLSQSDLLLSMATNQWEHLDAREEVRRVVQELNDGGSREFRFSKDVVLKSALMVAGVNLQFRVSNFTRDNMAKVEASWEQSKQSLIAAATLLGRFGYHARTLTADSVLLPLTYFFSRLEKPQAFLESTSFVSERDELRAWVARSLLKPGIWGSGLDTLLARLRTAIDENPGARFPVDAIERELTSLGKSLVFQDAELDDVLALRYSGPRTFAALSLLYPGLDFSQTFHEDHVFPRSRFTRAKLAAAGVDASHTERYAEYVDQLPNLQLLQDTANIEKQATLPAEWIERRYPEPEARAHYLHSNDLADLDLDFGSFIEVFEARRNRMRARLATVLRTETNHRSPAVE